MPSKTFDLQDPITGHGGIIHKLVFREPKFSDLMALGEPRTVSLSEEGRPFVIERPDVIQAYAERCLQEPKDFDIVREQLSLRDGFPLKEWIESFFNRGGRASEGSPTSPPTSGSNAAPTPAQSNA